MKTEVNCKYIMDEKFCTNCKVKKGLFTKRRKCIEFESFDNCPHFEEWDPYRFAGVFHGVPHKLKRVDDKTTELVPITSPKYIAPMNFINPKTRSTGPG